MEGSEVFDTVEVTISIPDAIDGSALTSGAGFTISDFTIFFSSSAIYKLMDHFKNLEASEKRQTTMRNKSDPGVLNKLHLLQLLHPNKKSAESLLRLTN